MTLRGALLYHVSGNNRTDHTPRQPFLPYATFVGYSVTVMAKFIHLPGQPDLRSKSLDISRDERGKGVQKEQMLPFGQMA